MLRSRDNRDLLGRDLRLQQCPVILGQPGEAIHPLDQQLIVFMAAIQQPEQL